MPCRRALFAWRARQPGPLEILPFTNAGDSPTDKVPVDDVLQVFEQLGLRLDALAGYADIVALEAPKSRRDGSGAGRGGEEPQRNSRGTPSATSSGR